MPTPASWYRRAGDILLDERNKRYLGMPSKTNPVPAKVNVVADTPTNPGSSGDLPVTAAGRAPTNAAGGPLLEPHDNGCRCWPHVSESDALRAIEHAALLEYRSGKAVRSDAGLRVLLGACRDHIEDIERNYLGDKRSTVAAHRLLAKVDAALAAKNSGSFDPEPTPPASGPLTAERLAEAMVYVFRGEETEVTLTDREQAAAILARLTADTSASSQKVEG